ncbi:MAG: 30S ribosome-binding factor RbfA [Myxococcota bacterium]|nr:30S ribosome-binding factor RbfA [Myxococcota bacterium]
MSIRIERIGEQVRGELSRLLRDEVSDPRIGMLSLTRVEVAPDLSTASVFWSPLDAEVAEVESMAAGLTSAAGFLRRRLAKELSLRRTPELRFRHDPALELGAHTLALLRGLENPDG